MIGAGLGVRMQVRFVWLQRALMFSVMVLVMVPPTLCAAQNPSPQTIKVKIDANQWDSEMVLKKLNAHGASGGMKFEAADGGYDYRIAFATGQHANTLLGLAGAGAVNYSRAEVTTFDAKGNALFHFERENRYTDSGAANAAAKEIVKRIRKLRASE